MANPGHAFAAYSFSPETFRTSARPLISPIYRFTADFCAAV